VIGLSLRYDLAITGVPTLVAAEQQLVIFEQLRV